MARVKYSDYAATKKFGVKRLLTFSAQRHNVRKADRRGAVADIMAIDRFLGSRKLMRTRTLDEYLWLFKKEAVLRFEKKGLAPKKAQERAELLAGLVRDAKFVRFMANFKQVTKKAGL